MEKLSGIEQTLKEIPQIVITPELFSVLQQMKEVIPELKLHMTPQMYQLIRARLDTMPYNFAAPLIGLIDSQIKNHFEPSQESRDIKNLAGYGTK